MSCNKNCECVICGSKKLIEYDRVPSGVISHEYKKRYGIDIEKFIDGEYISMMRCAECDICFYAGAKCGDDVFYEAMYTQKGFYEKSKPEFDFAIDKIVQASPGSILDVGCGTGAFLKKLGQSFDIAGLDKNPLALAVLEREGIKIDRDEDKYDFIVSFQTVEHVESPRDFILYMKKKLNPEGLLFLSVPNRDSVYCREVFDIHNFPPHHMTLWNKSSIENMAGILGFDIVEFYFEPLRLVHYQAVLNTRRESLMRSMSSSGGIRSLVSRGLMVAGRMLDRMLAPYFIDKVSCHGHTIGVLMKVRS